MAASVCDCGRPIPQREGPGRRRERCEVCSPTRPQPKRKAPVLTLATPQASAEPVSEASVAERTRAELEAVGRLECWQGAAALQVAQLIDNGGYTAQGAAALVKAHAEAMVRALEGAAGKADVVDHIFGSEVG